MNGPDPDRRPKREHINRGNADDRKKKNFGRNYVGAGVEKIRWGVTAGPKVFTKPILGNLKKDFVILQIRTP